MKTNRQLSNKMKQLLRLIAVTIAALAATAHPVGAADKGTFIVTDISQTASWSSEFQAGPPVLPRACNPDVCDFFRVEVRLPEDVWGVSTDDGASWSKPGGMLVATKPPPDFTNLNTFNLYIYGPDGSPVTTEPVAKADSFWSVGNHAVWVANPANGLYTVVVAPDQMLDPPALYDGFVSFDRGLTVKREETLDGMPYTQKFVAFDLASSPTPAVELLPDLVPTTPDNFHIATGVCFTFYACSPEPSQQPSCYPEETAGTTSEPPTPGQGPTRCLRFDQGEYNFGDGPFEYHIYPGQNLNVYQRIYSSDGSVSRQPLIGEAEFHPAHGHFHYKAGSDGWWDIKLHERLPNGKPGKIVSQFADKGICLIDAEHGRFGQRRNSPQAYGNRDEHDGSPCITPHHQDPNDPTFPDSPATPGGAPYIQSGISVGWADIYPWFVLDQYIPLSTSSPTTSIPITDVPDGKYVIVTKQDPGQRLHEKTTANNTAMACVEISGSGTIATAIPCSPPVPTSALSRKTHGSAGTFDVDLPLAGSPGIECRSGGADNDYRLVVTFPIAVTFDGATVTSGTGTVSGTSGSGTTALTVNLTGVTNAQTITLTLSGVNDGTASGDVGVRMGVLLGDVNSSRRTDAGDVTAVRDKTVSIPDQQTFRSDVNASGRIDAGDVTTTRNATVTVLP
jgi:hypothetical protein